MTVKTKKRSVEKQLQEMLEIFDDKNAWIQGVMAVEDAEAYDNGEGVDNSVNPKSEKAQAFCFVGAARRVGDGLELLTVLTQGVVKLKGFDLDAAGLENPFIDYEYNHLTGDWDIEVAKTPKDKNPLEEIMITFNDDHATSVADVRRLIRSALKRVQKSKEKK